jgi:hypothetical protein
MDGIFKKKACNKLNSIAFQITKEKDSPFQINIKLTIINKRLQTVCVSNLQDFKCLPFNFTQKSHR